MNPLWWSISQVWELCHRTPLFPQIFLIYARPPVLGMTLNCIIMPHDYYDNMWHVLMVKIPCIGYNLWTWSINFKALCCQLMTIGDSGYRQHGMSMLFFRKQWWLVWELCCHTPLFPQFLSIYCKTSCPRHDVKLHNYASRLLQQHVARAYGQDTLYWL